MLKDQLIRLGILLALGAICLVLPPRAAASSVTYTYTGNPFTQFAGGLSCPPDCTISGFFTVSSALPDNFNGLVTPASYDFTDGNVTINNGSFAYFLMRTDASGNIIGWDIALCSDFQCLTGDALATLSLSGGSPPAQDYAATDLSSRTSNNTPTHFAINLGPPGTWSEPEPSSLLLLAAGFFALGGLIRRRISDL